ncbi:hypothetical protein PV350_23785 [Streptomyces sp. PA03-6a]|nr:hypothetical protein [Streptomyces sp. PA03-6a]
MKNTPVPRRHLAPSESFKTSAVPLFSALEPAMPHQAAKRLPRPATTGLFQAPELIEHCPEEDEETTHPFTDGWLPRRTRI